MIYGFEVDLKNLIELHYTCYMYPPTPETLIPKLELLSIHLSQEIEETTRITNNDKLNGSNK